MKHFYAIEQTHGNVSVYSQYGKPILHVFDSKKEREEFVGNHSAKAITSNVAYAAYSKIVDDVRELGSQVLVH